MQLAGEQLSSLSYTLQKMASTNDTKNRYFFWLLLFFFPSLRCATLFLSAPDVSVLVLGCSSKLIPQLITRVSQLSTQNHNLEEMIMKTTGEIKDAERILFLFKKKAAQKVTQKVSDIGLFRARSPMITA